MTEPLPEAPSPPPGGTPDGTPSAAPPAAPTAPPTRSGPPVAAARRRRMWWLAGVVAAALLLTGGSVAVANALRSRYEVPSTDLFGSPSPSVSGPASPTPTPSPSPPAPTYAPIRGPLNILLVGIDPRESQPTWQPHADAVLIVHVPASLDRAYVTSLPRDLLVDVPAFRPAGFGGERTKLTHAMSYGSRVPGSQIPDVAQGFQLLARTVSGYTGIRRFDAGAVLNFRGFTSLVDAVGGVRMTVDQRVVSMHRRPDGRHRTPAGDGYVGPQMVYRPGPRTFNGWQALDYARQRYLPGGDYARQRHQQQLVKALIGKIASSDTVRDPRRLDRVLRAVGKTLTFDGRGRRVADFAYALRRLRPAGVTLVGLPGGGVGSGGGYLGEQLQPVAGRYFAALRGNRLPAFVSAHRSLVVRG